MALRTKDRHRSPLRVLLVGLAPIEAEAHLEAAPGATEFASRGRFRSS